MNKVVLMGRLTRDPDIRYSQGENQTCVARFTLAVDRRFKRDSDQTADFISCVAFGRTAEFIERYMRQGSRTCVEGRIQTGSYTDREGRKVYTTDVVVENAEFADSKPVQAATAPYPQAATAPYPQAAMPAQGYPSAPAPAPSPAQAPAQSENPVPAADFMSAPEPLQSPAFDDAAAREGFINIADGLDDEELPFK